jgi:anti-anti-sigma factor
MFEHEQLGLETREHKGIPLIACKGDIDLYTVKPFLKMTEEEIERSTGDLIVDLSEVPFLDSAGLSAIIIAYRKLDARKSKLHVIAPHNHPGVYRVLEVARLDTIISVYDSYASLDAALGQTG